MNNCKFNNNKKNQIIFKELKRFKMNLQKIVIPKNKLIILFNKILKI